MTNLTPIEKLQPCLLDRLADDEPDKAEESRQQRTVSLQKYRRGVLRDLEWLFNSQAYLTVEGLEPFKLKDYPEAFRSVINYGIRQVFGLSAPNNTQQWQDELAEAVRTFEPRLNARGLTLRCDSERNLVSFEVEGELWANPLPEHLHLKTVMDVETGQCLLGDSPHG
jgi:type VI secretion system protein ImpF